MRKWILLIFFVSSLFAISFTVYLINQPRVVLKPTAYKKLPGWEYDDHRAALLTFLNSCKEIITRHPDQAFGAYTVTGKVKDWLILCEQATKTPYTSVAAKIFFENHFKPYHLLNGFSRKGLFTGYYLPLLKGSLVKKTPYLFPVYGIPTDLIKINLTLFPNITFKKSLVGQMNGHYLRPYPPRAQINKGVLQNKAPVLFWCDNVLDIFFAQIQGSALVEFEDKQRALIGYAGDNGHPYTSIGKILLRQKSLNKENISMQTIREWLLQHPEQIESILNHDASYVFFNLTKNTSPIGVERIPLTPERSLAVDLTYIPLGVPVWLNTNLLTPDGRQAFQKLLVTQDTGGAIKGIIRGDVYWGAGSRAEFISGHMQQKGEYWLLLPRKISS